jgi:hypothetical protein
VIKAFRRLRKRLFLRFYFGSHRQVARVRRLVTACLHGFWLGVLNRSRLHQIDEAYYSADADYLNEASVRSGLQPWEQLAIGKYLPSDEPVAIIGAGSGRELLALLDLGYDAHGFECNTRLVEVGNRLLASSGVDRRIVVVPRDGWSVSSSTFGGVVVGWAAYMHIRSMASRVEFLRQLHENLPIGAPVLLSFLVRSNSTSYFRVSTKVGNAIRPFMGLEPVELGDALIPTYAHYFTRAEIEDELHEAGFKMVDFELTASPGYALAVGVAADR